MHAVPWIAPLICSATVFATETCTALPVPAAPVKEHPCAAPSLDERLRAAADAAVLALKVPPDQMRFQASSDLMDQFRGGPARLVNRTFLYRRLLEGVPAYGPGTSLRAVVGAGGELLSIEADWPPVLPIAVSTAAFSHLDPAALLERNPPPSGWTLEAVGIRYCTRPALPGTLEAVPALLALARRADAPSGDPGEPVFLPLTSAH